MLPNTQFALKEFLRLKWKLLFPAVIGLLGCFWIVQEIPSPTLKNPGKIFALVAAGVFAVWLVVLGIQRYVNSTKNGEQQDTSGTSPGISGGTWKKLPLWRRIIHYIAFVVIILLSVAILEVYGITDWRKQQTQETASKKDMGPTATAQLLPDYNNEVPPRNRSVIARPGMKSGEWPRDGFVRIPPGWGCTYQEEGRVFVRLNKDEKTVFLDEPLDDARDFEPVVSFEFKSAGDEEVIVHLTFFPL